MLFSLGGGVGVGGPVFCCSSCCGFVFVVVGSSLLFVLSWCRLLLGAVACCLLLVACCSLFVVRCVLFVVCCVLCVAC